MWCSIFLNFPLQPLVIISMQINSKIFIYFHLTKSKIAVSNSVVMSVPPMLVYCCRPSSSLLPKYQATDSFRQPEHNVEEDKKTQGRILSGSTKGVTTGGSCKPCYVFVDGFVLPPLSPDLPGLAKPKTMRVEKWRETGSSRKRAEQDSHDIDRRQVSLPS